MRSPKKSFAILLIMFITLFFMVGCLDFGDTYGDSASGVNSNDEFEPDNSPIKATEIKEGDSQTHHIYNENGIYDIDYIKFKALSSNKYKINLSEIKGFMPEITLYDTNGSEVLEMKNIGTHTGTYDWWGYDKDHNFSKDEKESIVFEPSSNGTYYISIKDLYGSHNAGSYKLNLSLVR